MPFVLKYVYHISLHLLVHEIQSQQNDLVVINQSKSLTAVGFEPTPPKRLVP